MLAQRAVLAFLAVLTGVCPSTAQNAVVSRPQAAGSLLYPRTDRLEREDRLAVIGDVQRTSFWGRLVLAENNLAEQRWLVNDLGKQRFRGLVLLGDMVFSSGDDNWSYFDELMAPLRRGPHQMKRSARRATEFVWNMLTIDVGVSVVTSFVGLSSICRVAS